MRDRSNLDIFILNKDQLADSLTKIVGLPVLEGFVKQLRLDG